MSSIYIFQFFIYIKIFLYIIYKMCDITPSEKEISEFLDKRLSSAGTDKIAVVMVGGPGSGKSSGKSKTISYLKKEIKDFVNIDPDEIITSLFSLNRNCYVPAGIINNKSFEKAIHDNKNIVFDGTGKNFEWYSENVIKRLKDNKYNVNLVIVTNNFNSVIKRIEEREKKEGRTVNLQYASEVYETLKTAIPKYIDLKCDFIDKIWLYDNSDVLKLILYISCIDGQKKLLCEYISGTCEPAQIGGKNKKRHFTVVMGGKEHGLYVSSTPSSATKKAVTKLCAERKKKKVEFHIREITQGSKKKTYGPYVGHIEKLNEPIELKGRVIKHKPVAKLSGKSGKKK